MSLLVGLLVLYGVRQLKRHFTLRARLPELLRRLRKHTSRVSGHLNDFDTFADDARVELAKAHATLRSLEKKLRGSTKKSCKQVRKKVARQRQGALTANSLRGLYEDMTFLMQELTEHEADLTWS